MKKIFGCITCIQLLCITRLYSQPTLPYGNLVSIKTGEGVYRGELYETGDSGISILKRKQNKIFQYPVSNINQVVIKSKAPVSLEIIKSTAAGALLAAFLITWAYLYNACHHFSILNKDDPPYREAMLYGLPVGAAIGFSGQAFEAVFIHVRIPINKSQYLFEQKKAIIKKRSAFTVL
jgi:hypothetical protein